MREFLINSLISIKLSNGFAHLAIAIPRIIGGYFLAVNFGGSKFGMPWTDPAQGLGLFEVANWFPKDVAEFGIPFSLAPVFFAWMAAASEAMGGFLWVLGLGTRWVSALLIVTMLVAIFFQKWNEGVWGMLPALGFLWLASYNLVLGSGKFGLDHLLISKFNKS